ncbi:MAG: ATP-binding protein [Bacteroidota bacterium]|nr:ATP-binding protein [Bacteroidota bacterium]
MLPDLHYKAAAGKIIPALSDINYYFDILGELIQARIRAHFAGIKGSSSYFLPAFDHGTDPLSQFVRKNKLSIEEHYLLLIALTPHVRPEFFDQQIQEALPQPGDFPIIGGVRGKQFRGFLPTGETVLFLLAGEDWCACQELFHRLFGPGHLFAKKKIAWLEAPPDGEPLMSGKLMMSQSLITYFTTGKEHLPHYSSNFPAQRLKTSLEWNDMVLNPNVRQQINEIRSWFYHSGKLMKQLGMSKKLNPGYRALFFGPPGTGKTLCANLLGKEFKKYVFRVDLSGLVSKYIGETEKNLARLFDEAEYKNWILFFDEADALFGKRTQVKDAHDRYANQEVSYLMQRIETFEGLVVLASNLKANIDEAFARRFQSIVYFPYPSPEEQLLIWKKAFPRKLKPAVETDLQQIAQRYKLTGANIMNIVQYCCLAAMEQKQKEISIGLLTLGIQRELSKEGKLV